MADTDKKVYVEWPTNEDSFRFVSSRLGEDSSDHETDSLEEEPTRITQKAIDIKSGRPLPEAKKISVNQPNKFQSQTNGSVKGMIQSNGSGGRLKEFPQEILSEDDTEELQREAAYQAELQKRLLKPQKAPPIIKSQDSPRSTQDESPIPPLNFNDIDRSSMQDFFHEEIDIDLRSSEDEQDDKKGIKNKPPMKPNALQFNKPKQPKVQNVAVKKTEPINSFAPQQNRPNVHKNGNNNQFMAQQHYDADDSDSRDQDYAFENTHLDLGEEEQEAEQIEDAVGEEWQQNEPSASPRAEAKWASQHAGAQKPRGGKPPIPVKKVDRSQAQTQSQSQHQQQQQQNFIAENKQLNREKPKKSYAAMLRNKLGQDTESSSTNTSANVKKNGSDGSAASKGGKKPPPQPEQQEEAANFAQPAPMMAAAPYAAPGMFAMTAPYQSMMPAFAGGVPAFYQPPMPAALHAFQPVPNNFMPYAMPMPYAQPQPMAPYGAQLMGGVDPYANDPYAIGGYPMADSGSLQNSYAGAQFHEHGAFQRQATHFSQPDLSRAKTESTKMKSLSAMSTKPLPPTSQKSKPNASAEMQRARTQSVSPTRQMTQPGGVFTVVTLQRHTSPLPPINDHLHRVKNNIDHGIPASAAPTFDAGYKDLYSKQKQGPDYKKYTLRDYRNIQQVDKLDHRLGPDLDSAEYKERLERRKRQQMYGRKVYSENKKVLAEEREAVVKAKQDAARFGSYDDPEDVGEGKRLEVVDIGDARYPDMARNLEHFQTQSHNLKQSSQRSAQSETQPSQASVEVAVKPGVRRVDHTPPPAPSKLKGPTAALPPRPAPSHVPVEEPSDYHAPARSMQPAAASSSNYHNNPAADGQRKFETRPDKAATVLPNSGKPIEEREPTRPIADMRQESIEDSQKMSKRELAKQYAQQIRKQHMDVSKKKRDTDTDSQRPMNSSKTKHSTSATYYELENLDQELVKLHERHLMDKARAEAIRQAY